MNDKCPSRAGNTNSPFKENPNMLLWAGREYLHHPGGLGYGNTVGWASPMSVAVSMADVTAMSTCRNERISFNNCESESLHDSPRVKDGLLVIGIETRTP